VYIIKLRELSEHGILISHEKGAVKLVVGVLNVHISLLNVTYVCSCILIYSI